MKNLKLSIKILLFVGLVIAIGNKEVKATSFPTSEVSNLTPHDSSVFPALSSSTMVVAPLNISSGPAIVYAVHLGSVASSWSNFVVLTDTAPPFNGAEISTITAVAFAQQQTTNGNGTIVQFNPPLRFYRGIQARSTGCSSLGVAGFCYAIIYDKVGLRRP